MNRPSPVPISDLVANFENSLGNISGSIPVAVSLTETVTWLFSLSHVIAIEIESSAVFLENLIALFNRLEITWLILYLSAWINTGEGLT